MDFTDLESARQQEAERRLKLLGMCTRDDCTDRQLRDRSAETLVAAHYLADWLHKYRLYGIDGLRPSHWAPLDQKRPPPELGSLEQKELDKALDDVAKYWPLIEPFVHQLHSSNTDIEKHAKKHGVSFRTVRRLLSLYKTYGLSGLVTE